MESSKRTATAEDSERSGRGGEGEMEIEGAWEQGLAPAPATTWKDEADVRELEATGRDLPLRLV